MDVVSIDLSRVHDIPSPPFGGRDVYLVVSSADDVLGAGFVPGQRSTAGLVEEITRLLQNDWRARAVAAAVGHPEAWQPPLTRPDLSATVGICTRRRPADLERCLAAIRPQLEPGDEIVVVDNDPHGASEEVARRYGARWYQEARPGSGWARNRVIAESRCPVLAFIDDDCVADRSWLTALLAGFADPRVSVVTGSVVADRVDQELPRLVDARYPYHRGWLPLLFDGTTGTDLSPFDSWAVGTGASMAWRKEFLETLGGFDPALGAGTAVFGGEDLDAFTRALASGARIAYQPAALVRHRHPETRRALRRQLMGYARCSGAHAAKAYLEHRRYRPIRVIAREWRWELGWSAREIVNRLAGRPYWPVTPLIAHPLLAAHGATRFIRHHRALRSGRAA